MQERKEKSVLSASFTFSLSMDDDDLGRETCQKEHIVK